MSSGTEVEVPVAYLRFEADIDTCFSLEPLHSSEFRFQKHEFRLLLYCVCNNSAEKKYSYILDIQVPGGSSPFVASVHVEDSETGRIRPQLSQKKSIPSCFNAANFTIWSMSDIDVQRVVPIERNHRKLKFLVLVVLKKEDVLTEENGQYILDQHIAKNSEVFDRRTRKRNSRREERSRLKKLEKQELQASIDDMTVEKKKKEKKKKNKPKDKATLGRKEKELQNSVKKFEDLEAERDKDRNAIASAENHFQAVNTGLNGQDGEEASLALQLVNIDSKERQTECCLPEAIGKACSTTSTSVQTSVLRSVTPCLESLSEDLAKLMVQDSDPDMEFLCGGQSTRAHKSIVCSRSPVIAAMMASDKVEGRTDVVTIPNMEPDVFKIFLGYLYSGKLEELTFDAALTLYGIGGQYAVPSLTKRCLQFLMEHLSVENACEVLAAVDPHGDSEIVENVIEYILENEIPLISDRWSTFCKDHPELSIKVLTHFYKTSRSIGKN